MSDIQITSNNIYNKPAQKRYANPAIATITATPARLAYSNTVTIKQPLEPKASRSQTATKKTRLKSLFSKELQQKS